MQGISSKTFNFAGAENNKKFNSIEHNKDFDLNMYEAFYRNLDPQIGRFWQIDPKLESAEAWSSYVAMLNNPIRYPDPLGDSTIKPKWHPPMSSIQTNGNTINPFAPLIYQGYANVKGEAVRAQYNNEVAKLNPNDKQGRADLKEKARTNTPEPFKTMIEKSRPMSGERAKVNDPSFKGDATKTNFEVNETAKTTGALGKIFLGSAILQSTMTIATSENPVKETATEGTGWAGAMYLGGQFATFTAPAGPIASTLSGVVGSIIGFVAGKQGGEILLKGIQQSAGQAAKYSLPNLVPFSIRF